MSLTLSQRTEIHAGNDPKLDAYLQQENLAVVIVDMQKQYLRVVSPPRKRADIVMNQLILLDKIKAARIPLKVLECRYGPNRQYGGETIDELKRVIQKIPGSLTYEKGSSDGFTERSFSKAIEEEGIERILLTGIWAGACVMSTGIGAIEKGRAIGREIEVKTTEYLVADSIQGTWRKEYRRMNWFL